MLYGREDKDAGKLEARLDGFGDVLREKMMRYLVEQ
jgi:hypothetical protein